MYSFDHKDIEVKDLKTGFNPEFNPSEDYLNSLPDLQNSDFKGIPIDFVGIHDFRLPIKVRQRAGGEQEVMARVTGTVSLDAANRGINMSRIIRTFYKSKDDVFDINKLEEVLRNYQKDLKTFDAHVLVNFDYYLWLPALVSRKSNGEKEGGYQYYNITFDCNLDHTGEFKKVMHVDFIYSSACPCSTALSEHAAYTQGLYGIPHSQRSCARISIDFNKLVWIEDVIDVCRRELVTETQVFVKRPDEQQFALMNGSQPKFVEDAIRMLADGVGRIDGVNDYKIICSHQESLHSHDAIAVITKGIKNSIFNHHVSFEEWQSLKK